MYERCNQPIVQGMLNMAREEQHKRPCERLFASARVEQCGHGALHESVIGELGELAAHLAACTAVWPVSKSRVQCTWQGQMLELSRLRY
jgi:hypothetical protein